MSNIYKKKKKKVYALVAEVVWSNLNYSPNFNLMLGSHAPINKESSLPEK